MTKVDIGIIGLGPWGLSVLTRIVDQAYNAQIAGRIIDIHVIEPGMPGVGCHTLDQPDYLLLNTVCGQISMFPREAFMTKANNRFIDGPSFLEWARASHYKMFGGVCKIAHSGGRDVTPHDFLPRNVLGHYLHWVYQWIANRIPHNVRLHLHETRAIDIQKELNGKEMLYMENGATLAVDHVVITTGHTENIDDEWIAQGLDDGVVIKPYPVTRYVETIDSHESVAVSGMGLVALDVITALTIGRGGRYVGKAGDLQKHYVPSGREPAIYMYSYNGLPSNSRPATSMDLTGSYAPLFFTKEAVHEIQERKPLGLNFRHDVLPLLWQEMTAVYYYACADIQYGKAAAELIRDSFSNASSDNDFRELTEKCQRQYGEFNAATLFFCPLMDRLSSTTDYQSHICDLLKDDLTESQKGESGSPRKAALEIFRVLRNHIRTAVDFCGLSPDSYEDFVKNISPLINRAVVGPPITRSEELLALIEAGIVKIPFGPYPQVEYIQETKKIRVTSTRLQHPYSRIFDKLLLGRLDQPSIERSASPLLSNLYKHGRLQALTYRQTAIGSIELSRDFHPINKVGEREERLWILGPLSEGVKYFNHYLPSPKSRVQAFLDADACIGKILSTTLNTVKIGEPAWVV